MLAQFRSTYQKFMAPVGVLSVRLGLTPNFWTIFSVLMAMVGTYILAQSMWTLGLVFVSLVMLVDAFDGATARAGNSASPFGSVLDHSMDRYAEFFLLLGILLSGHVPAWLIYTTIFGMVMASYVRAKAESVGGLKDGAVGWAGRAEKMLFLGVGLGLEGLFNLNGAIFWGILIIGVISHITFIQRLLFTHTQLTKNPTSAAQKSASSL
jgi:phosphatidylglycerophosphate synthase